MGRKKTIFVKQLIAAFLLSVLSVVTIIQVSHSHSSTSSNHEQEKSFVKKTGLPGYSTATAESKCFICEYQLAKDVDTDFSIVAIDPPTHDLFITEAKYSFSFQRISSPIDTRGPPCIS